MSSRRLPRSRSAQTRHIENEPPAFTHAAVANQYARDVVEGRIIACKEVKQACQRHLNDLARAKDGGWNYVFDEAKANHACRFIEGLPHTKGDWAARGEKIVLQPWQCFIVCAIFGWLKRVSRKRRFRLVYACVPRKNAKSALAAAIGNYMFAADGEFGAEVYCGATTEKQAWEVFRPARLMVERTPELQEAFGIEVVAKQLLIPSNGSRFEPVIGKPGDGPSPHCAIIDEYHEHADDSMFDAFQTGMGARTQPLLLVITTAGTDLAGPCRSLQSDIEKILAGSLERDEYFGIIYTLDADDDWTSESALQKANPNYGVSVFGDYLRAQQQTAIQTARKQNVVKTKHFNLWVGAATAYFNIQRWNELADPSLNADEFRGLSCYAAVDLSSKKDVTARVKVFKKTIDRKDHFYVFANLYLPELRVQQPEFRHYQGWVADGSLQTTHGATIDYEQITAETIVDVQRYRIIELGFDPWNAEQFAQLIAKETPAKAVEIPQKVQYLSEPMKNLDALITDGRLHHDGNPALTWMMGNIAAHEDKNENVFPIKEREENKIDGGVALIMAISLASAGRAAPKSAYATRGLRFL